MNFTAHKDTTPTPAVWQALKVMLTRLRNAVITLTQHAESHAEHPDQKHPYTLEQIKALARKALEAGEPIEVSGVAVQGYAKAVRTLLRVYDGNGGNALVAIEDSNGKAKIITCFRCALGDEHHTLDISRYSKDYEIVMAMKD